MDEKHEFPSESTLIPIIVDVERNIDGYQMIRCSYLSVQSDEPLPNWFLNTPGLSSPILLLNLEAILVGAPDKSNNFGSHNDITKTYDFIEEHDELFIDINDIWVPIDWFGKIRIDQGMVFRIPQNLFTICWKLRNDKISTEEMFGNDSDIGKPEKDHDNQMPIVRFSEEETYAFGKWTEMQIKESRVRYNEDKEMALKKIINE